jgi:hypothetical protein
MESNNIIIRSTTTTERTAVSSLENLTPTNSSRTVATHTNANANAGMKKQVAESNLSPHQYQYQYQ